MVGLVTDYDDVILVIGLVIFAPLIFVFGIAAILASIGAAPWIVILTSILNISLVIFLLYRWQLIQSLKNTVDDFLQSS